MLTPSITHERRWPHGFERQVAGPSRRAGLLAGIAHLAAAAAREYRARRAARRLMALDDRTLRDIGLGRGEIERAAWTGRDLT